MLANDIMILSKRVTIYKLLTKSKQLQNIIKSKDFQMTVNIWKSYAWTADKEVNMKAIFAVMNTT